MIKRRYWYLAVNIFVVIASIWNWHEINIFNEIKHSLLFFIFTIILTNVAVYVLDIIYQKFFDWYEKRTKENYNFYDWLGNPESPIKIYNEFSNKGTL